MSTVIIIGGGGHNSLTKLVVEYPHATSDQKARILALVQDFIDKAETLVTEVQANG